MCPLHLGESGIWEMVGEGKRDTGDERERRNRMEMEISIKGGGGMEEEQHDQPSLKALSNSKFSNYGLGKV